MFANIGWVEILILGLLVLVLFGGSKLPKLARGLGESGKELKKAKKDFKDAMNEGKE